MVIVNFIRDKEVGIFARAKRLGKGRVLNCNSVDTMTPSEQDVESISDSGSTEEESDKCE